MGRYINVIDGKSIGASFIEKSTNIVKYGGTEINQPIKFESDLVCVVDNGYFAAAAHCYSKDEFNQFSRDDGRPTKWFKLPNAAIYAAD